jgi:hypothetical protein
LPHRRSIAGVPLVKTNDRMTNDNNEQSPLARALNVLGWVASIVSVADLGAVSG